MTSMRVRTHYYQQFDADFGRDVPAEGYGGWGTDVLELSLEHTALVVMHAWDCGTRTEYPGWHRMVEYIPRADAICRDVFPGLLGAVRAAGMTLLHVVSPGSAQYYQAYPGYLRALALAGPDKPVAQVENDPIRQRLQAFRAEHSNPGLHNRDDIARGFERLTFAPNAFPQGEEGVAENAAQLLALCQEGSINHLIYAGFAINWCLLMSPGGMVDMRRHGLMCSTLRQAVTAVENRESARQETCKELALWRVAVAFGFVYDVDDLIQALRAAQG